MLMVLDIYFIEDLDDVYTGTMVLIMITKVQKGLEEDTLDIFG